MTVAVPTEERGVASDNDKAYLGIVRMVCLSERVMVSDSSSAY